MSVLISTSLGDIVVDLWVEDCPIACFNFISLCKIKYYNNCKIFNIEKNAWFQTGDPTSEATTSTTTSTTTTSGGSAGSAGSAGIIGKGGCSIFHLIEQYKQKKSLNTENIYFNDEINIHKKHNMEGLLCMANKDGKPNTNASQFYITTTGRHLDYLDGKHTIFGRVEEGMEVIKAIDKLYTEKKNDMEIPIQTVRIRHTQILFDPFEEEESLRKQFESYLDEVSVLIPPKSPLPIRDDDIIEISKEKQLSLASEEQVLENESNIVDTKQEEYEAKKEREAKSKAIVLEMIGDLPDADIKPPESVLFVCRLNPITTEKSLRTIFSQFGNIVKCEVVKNRKTGKSKTFAFIEFEESDSCERAFLKSEGVVIDDHKIHVDFSQSIAHLWWQNEKEKKDQEYSSSNSTKIKERNYGNTSNNSSSNNRRDYNDTRHHNYNSGSGSSSNRDYNNNYNSSSNRGSNDSRSNYYRGDNDHHYRRDNNRDYRREDYRDNNRDYRRDERRLDNDNNKRKYNDNNNRYNKSERSNNDNDQTKKQKR